MLKVNEVAFFCYPVTDMTRARSFYEGILGLKATLVTEKPGMTWVEYDIGATTLSIGTAPGWTPSTEGGNIALEVDDFEKSVAHLKAEKVPFAMEPLDTPVCHMAIISDPDGSRLLIHKRKPGHG
jgi:predicted enzyme related to lactoylglutathione lyase